MANLTNSILRRVRLLFQMRQVAQGVRGIDELGHRGYVGGYWNELGELQFKFLLERGLLPHHYLLDIACGSLRAGVKTIPYLETGHYLGIEKESALIDAGIQQELGKEMYEKKKPQFVISDSFEFEKFDRRPNYAIAQSLFTHLPPDMIHDCFRKLRPFIQDGGEFYATYFESEVQKYNPSRSHDRLSFLYTRDEMQNFGTQNRWTATYIGDWGHPRKQVMIMYRAL